MGAGASADAKNLSKLEEKELKEYLKNMDAGTAMKLCKAMDAAGTRGSEMKCAIWLWNEEQAAEFLKEVCDAKECEIKKPEKMDGKMLLLDEVKWEKPEDGEKVQEMLKKVAFIWCQDQCMAKTPFIPPVASKKRAAWLWDESVVKEFFDEVFSEEYYEGGGGDSSEGAKEVKKVETPKCDGKTLLNEFRDKLDEAAQKHLMDAMARTTFLLMQDILIN